jgi:hypothetical protein
MASMTYVRDVIQNVEGDDDIVDLTSNSKMIHLPAIFLFGFNARSPLTLLCVVSTSLSSGIHPEVFHCDPSLDLSNVHPACSIYSV